MATLPPQRSDGNSAGLLASILGVSAIVVAGISSDVTRNEGMKYRAYYDPAHVLTICGGDTENVHVGEVDTQAQCDARLDRQLVAKARPIVDCTPSIKGHGVGTGAVLNFAYNIGVGAYCKSTTAKMFNANRWTDACNHMLDYSAASATFKIKGAVSCKPLASGRYLCVLPGLVTRRKENQVNCLKGATSWISPAHQ